MPIPHSLYDTPNPNVNIFNKKMISLAKKSKSIYDQHGFFYPDYLLGLDTMGSQLTPVAIRGRIK